MRKKILTGVLLAGTAAVTLISGILYTNGRNIQQKLADKVLRFHVLANSDSEAGRTVKISGAGCRGQLFAKRTRDGGQQGGE